MPSAVKHFIKIQEGYQFKGVGGLVVRLVHPDICGSDQLGMGIVYMNPGEELPPHSHFNEEAYFIISGTGIARVDGEEFPLEKNMAVYMPANSVHYTKNTGSEPLIFTCSLSPAPVVK